MLSFHYFGIILYNNSQIRCNGHKVTAKKKFKYVLPKFNSDNLHKWITKRNWGTHNKTECNAMNEILNFLIILQITCLYLCLPDPMN